MAGPRGERAGVAGNGDGYGREVVSKVAQRPIGVGGSRRNRRRLSGTPVDAWRSREEG
jgi:hypothetical protein